MIKRSSFLILIALILILFGSCVNSISTNDHSQPAGSTARVVVTRDFGKELILEQDIETFTGISALAVLQSVAEIETKYGGSFVSSINGISSEYGRPNSNKEDWFFYINGISANMGAGDYIFSAGDVEHWDFRNWGYHQFIPAIIGDYPQPFLSGYSGRVAQTFIVYDAVFSLEAEALVEKLKSDGIVQVSAIRCDMLSTDIKEQSNLIIIAGPDNNLIVELNNIHDKLGYYAHLESSRIMVLDTAGNLSGEYGLDSGIIQATQNPWNPKGIGAGENVVWIVTGTNVNGVKNAASLITDKTDHLSGVFAVIIHGEQVEKIP